MEFIIRVQEHSEYEKHLHQKMSFSLLDGVNYQTGTNSDNIISVSSNMKCFTTLTSICGVLNLNERIQKDVDECNKMNKSRFLHLINPSFFMIPYNFNDENIIDFPEFYISELCKVSHYFQAKTVHFTHYSFIDKFPWSEIVSAMTLLLNPVFVPSVEKFFWEIDSRFLDDIKSAYRHVIENIYRRSTDDPKIIYAKKFKFARDENTSIETHGNLLFETGRFVEDT